jgi:hypothetical protein
MTSPIEETIFALLAERPTGGSIAPSDVARALEPEAWRRQLPKVRAVSIGLARQGLLVITRHNKPADPDTFRGVYRLRLPGPPAAEGDENSKANA